MRNYPAAGESMDGADWTDKHCIWAFTEKRFYILKEEKIKSV